jgi:hypothetical protein
MSDTLTAISELEKALRSGATIEDAEKWWTHFVTIEYGIISTANQSKEEKRRLQQVRSTLSTAIRHVREGIPSPNISSALVALGALRASVERSTIGNDGWPLRGSHK